MLPFLIALLFSSVFAIELRNGAYVGRRVPAWIRVTINDGQSDMHLTIAMITVLNVENVPITSSRINEQIESEMIINLDSTHMTEGLKLTNRAVSAVASTIEASGVTATYYEHGPDGFSENPVVVVIVRDITNRKILHILADFVVA
jgi:hypothetical protein